MRRLGARIRKLLGDQRGSFLVEYSSFALLIAIAAIALLTHVTGVPE